MTRESPSDPFVNFELDLNSGLWKRAERELGESGEGAEREQGESGEEVLKIRAKNKEQNQIFFILNPQWYMKKIKMIK